MKEKRHKSENVIFSLLQKPVNHLPFEPNRTLIQFFCSKSPRLY
jgi:hypothetical protein